jgi:hypothetical protein
VRRRRWAARRRQARSARVRQLHTSCTRGASPSVSEGQECIGPSQRGNTPAGQRGRQRPGRSSRVPCSAAVARRRASAVPPVNHAHATFERLLRSVFRGLLLLLLLPVSIPTHVAYAWL